MFTAHLFSAMFIFLAAMLSIESAADRYLVLLLLQLVLLLGMVVYTIIALHATYRERWSKSIFKSLALLFLFMPILSGAIELASHLKI